MSGINAKNKEQKENLELNESFAFGGYLFLIAKNTWEKPFAKIKPINIRDELHFETIFRLHQFLQSLAHVRFKHECSKRNKKLCKSIEDTEKRTQIVKMQFVLHQKILKTDLRSFSLIRLQFINLMNDFPSIFSKLFKQLVGWCNKLYKIGSSRILNENLIKKNQRKIAS